jgi:Kdo2-lipid IVA lauroyltransferase/acyltransferase
MSHVLEYVLFQIAGFLLRLLPLRTVQRLGAAGGEFVGMTLGYRKTVAMENLRNAFPEWDQTKLDRVLRGSFRSVGTALFEFMCLPNMSADEVNKVCRVTNADLVQKIYSRGNGALMLTAHYGNWELFAQAFFTSTGIPLHIITKPQTNKYVDKKINLWRTRFGNRVVAMDSIREMMRLLRENKAVGIVADQTASKESIAVPFFGREVPTYEGPAVLSLKTKTPLVAGFAVRMSDGTYNATFEEIPSKDLTEFSPQNVAELTRRHVALTESRIREHPEQWMWMHKRWKHVPSRVTTEKV